MSETRCFLRPIDATHDPVQLLDNTPLQIGRGPSTKIKDSRCSRNQVLFVANFSKRSVMVTQLGRNACGLEGEEMKKDESVEMFHGQKFDVLLGHYSYILEFVADAAPNKSSKEQKRTFNDVSDSDEEMPPAKQTKLITEKSVGGTSITQHLWETAVDQLIFKSPACQASAKIAAYDLDGTLIVTESGRTFPKNATDWKISYQQVIPKLKQLVSQGFKIVIFTNQASLENAPNTGNLVRSFQGKIEKIVTKLDVPVEVFIAKGRGLVRKPCIGMWKAMVARNENIEIDKSVSFYCGDAAGRIAPGKSDFSQADVLFAKNVDITFHVPETHFLEKKVSFKTKITAFDYKSLPTHLPLCDPEYRQICSQRPEMILLVGCQGSGKSHFVATHLEPAGYSPVSRDKMGSMEACIAKAKELLDREQFIVVDNTNPTVAARRKFIDLANTKSMPVRIFIMNTTMAHAKHNNKFRYLTDPNHAIIGDALINKYFSSYEEPSLSECTEIVKINFWPTFKTRKQEELYRQFLCEK